MHLSRPVSAGEPLVVIALEEEAAHLSDDVPVLITGIGKVNAATSLALTLAQGERPTEVVNLGTAGALKPGWAGTHEVARVVQHDFDSELIGRLIGRPVGDPIALSPSGAVVATGDAFINSEADRLRLARIADLVDMEGYAIASVARRFNVPVRLIKHVSDEADEAAARSWAASVDECARHLAGWHADNR